MKRLALACLMVCLAVMAAAQIRVTGQVTDSQSGKPLAKVIVSARDKIISLFSFLI